MLNRFVLQSLGYTAKRVSDRSGYRAMLIKSEPMSNSELLMLNDDFHFGIQSSAFIIRYHLYIINYSTAILGIRTYFIPFLVHEVN